MATINRSSNADDHRNTQIRVVSKKHPKWGVGVILEIRGNRARVLFLRRLANHKEEEWIPGGQLDWLQSPGTECHQSKRCAGCDRLREPVWRYRTTSGGPVFLCERCDRSAGGESHLGKGHHKEPHIGGVQSERAGGRGAGSASAAPTVSSLKVRSRDGVRSPRPGVGKASKKTPATGLDRMVTAGRKVNQAKKCEKCGRIKNPVWRYRTKSGKIVFLCEQCEYKKRAARRKGGGRRGGSGGSRRSVYTVSGGRPESNRDRF